MGSDLVDRLNNRALQGQADASLVILREAADRITELESILSALPQCWTLLDGKLSRTRAVVPWMDVYTGWAAVPVRHFVVEHTIDDIACYVGFSVPTDDLADSPEAAKALRKQRGEGR